MMKNSLVAALFLLVMVPPLRAESIHVELKYISVEDALRCLTHAFENRTPHEEIKAMMEQKETVIKGVRIRFDSRMNNMDMKGRGKAVRRMANEVWALDVRPTQVKVEVVFLSVEVDEDLPSAMDLLGKDVPASPGIYEGKNADLDALVENACASKRATVVSRPVLSCVGFKEATVETGDVGGGVHTFKVTPLVNSKDEITLQMEAIWVKDGATSQLNTTVRLPGGATVGFGGTIVEEEGKKRELLLLVRPTVIEGAEGE